MTKSDVRVLYSDLNKLLDDICVFLDTSLKNGELSGKAKVQASFLIERSKTQLQEISKVSTAVSDNEPESYVDMGKQPEILPEYIEPQMIYNPVDDVQEINHEPQSGVTIITYTEEEETNCPFDNLPAQDASIDKFGYLDKREKFVLYYNKRIYAAVYHDWLLMYLNDKDHKPIEYIYLRAYEAKPVVTLKEKSFELFKFGDINGKSLFFTALTKKDMEQWVEAINGKLNAEGDSLRSTNSGSSEVTSKFMRKPSLEQPKSTFDQTSKSYFESLPKQSYDLNTKPPYNHSNKPSTGAKPKILPESKPSFDIKIKPKPNIEPVPKPPPMTPTSPNKSSLFSLPRKPKDILPPKPFISASTPPPQEEPKEKIPEYDDELEEMYEPIKDNQPEVLMKQPSKLLSIFHSRPPPEPPRNTKKETTPPLPPLPPAPQPAAHLAHLEGPDFDDDDMQEYDVIGHEPFVEEEEEEPIYDIVVNPISAPPKKPPEFVQTPLPPPPTPPDNQIEEEDEYDFVHNATEPEIKPPPLPQASSSPEMMDDILRSRPLLKPKLFGKDKPKQPSPVSPPVVPPMKSDEDMFKGGGKIGGFVHQFSKKNKNKQ